MVEDAALADDNPVVRRPPLCEPRVGLAAFGIPAAPAGSGNESAGRGADVEELPGAADRTFDFAQRVGERPLASLDLRDVRRVVALRVAGKNQVTANAGVDVLKRALPALDELIDQQLVTRGAELHRWIDVLFAVVLRLVDDVEIVRAAEETADRFQVGVKRWLVHAGIH